MQVSREAGQVGIASWPAGRELSLGEKLKSGNKVWDPEGLKSMKPRDGRLSAASSRLDRKGRDVVSLDSLGMNLNYSMQRSVRAKVS